LRSRLTPESSREPRVASRELELELKRTVSTDDECRYVYIFLRIIFFYMNYTLKSNQRGEWARSKREGDAGVADWGPRGACGVASAATSCRQCRGGWLPELWEAPQARSKARPRRQASAQVGRCDCAGCVQHPMTGVPMCAVSLLSLPPAPSPGADINLPCTA
jgi:hypothetical protein